MTFAIFPLNIMVHLRLAKIHHHVIYESMDRIKATLSFFLISGLKSYPIESSLCAMQNRIFKSPSLTQLPKKNIPIF